MALFEPKTYNFIRQRILNRVVARSLLTDVEVGGGVETLASAVARELDDISFQMVNLQKVWDIDTATGEDLDERARDFNPDEITRRGATAATGAVVFSRTGTAGAITIPEGTEVEVASGGPTFLTTAAGAILNASSVSAAIPIRAVNPGSAGNVDAGAITIFSSVPGVEAVTNTANTSNGQDEETDAQLRARLKAYARSLTRGTPEALRFAALSATLPTGERVSTAEVIELDAPNLGTTEVYIDNGLGTVATTASAAGEVVVAAATGGEIRFTLGNVPLVGSTTVNVRRNTNLLVEGADYTLNRARGTVTLDTTVFPSGLTAGDVIDADYTYYTGLLAEVQKVIDGDPNDRTSYPGYRAAGTLVSVLPPTLVTVTISGSLVIEEGFNPVAVREQAEAALVRYVNSLGINDDVIFTSLIAAAKAINGVFDVQFSTPTNNIVISFAELARTTTANITLA